MKHAFVFIEVFGCEGGIQSYIQDVLGAYAQLANRPNDCADVFLLRDIAGKHPLKHSPFSYHYFKNEHLWKERVSFTLAFATYLVRQRPEHVFCGHINLAGMVSQLCRLLNIPYTVLTYGKEVWCELPIKDKRALSHAHNIWT
ncbi:glycosyl transferase group 1, partial [cf. Phormidesmis sp. LEGE 11477]|nr:glycosyl transferase group 1 [cf. Phormidesmis sp. LEGE 11477]